MHDRWFLHLPVCRFICLQACPVYFDFCLLYSYIFPSCLPQIFYSPVIFLPILCYYNIHFRLPAGWNPSADPGQTYPALSPGQTYPAPSPGRAACAGCPFASGGKHIPRVTYVPGNSYISHRQTNFALQASKQDVKSYHRGRGTRWA